MIKTTIESLQQAVERLNSGDFLKHLQGKGAVDDEKFMADLATRLWRIRSNMWQPGSQEPFKDVERSHRHLERLIARLEQSGIRIVDKVGEFYDPGMTVKVVSSETMPGIRREIIQETIEPAVFRNDRLIQQAQIVVGIPIRDDNRQPVETTSEEELQQSNSTENQTHEDPG